jgi:hypothetical protein
MIGTPCGLPSFEQFAGGMSVSGVSNTNSVK